MESVLFASAPSRSTSRDLSDPKLLFFSGGTALNSIAQLLKSHTSYVSYIMPISDNGGSTAEILRVIGGPAIGDIRSRLVRLADDSTIEAESVRKLLQHRLPEGRVDDDSKAKFEWHNIVEGTHPLWNNISEPYKETIRAFLVYFHSEILRQSANKKFDFRNGSIGNFFFTGARLFFCSLETAIFWFSRISGIGPNTSVIPVINHNSGLTIGVELSNGDRIHGQNDISHPPTHSCIIVDKEQTQPLSSPIKRVFYLNNDLQEIEPPVNSVVLQKIQELDTIVYGMGSLYTSIVPLLVLKGVGEAILKKEGKKVLLLNGYTDRETYGMTAVDFIYAIVDALDVKCVKPDCVNKYVTHLVYSEQTKIPIDFVFISQVLKIKIESVPSTIVNKKVYFEEKALVQYLCNK